MDKESNLSKEPIKIRQKKLNDGSISLYLDIYWNGKRKYEFLKLYLAPGNTPSIRSKNKQTLQLANSIKAQRQIEIQNHEYGFKAGFKTETNFLDYYRNLCTERLGSPGNWGNWKSCLRHLEGYCKPNTTFKDVDAEFVKGFRTYLDKTARTRPKYKNITTINDTKPLSQNSKVSYFNKLRACINQAFEDRIIPENPLRGIDGFKQEETERSYLTIEEVKALINTECRYPALKQAFLFSCLTGIRKSDIEKMRWKEITKQGDFTRIIFKQKKTGGQEYLDISKQAEALLGERRKPDQLVFAGFRYSAYMLTELLRWCVEAGITKNVTFHTGRHTFAVTMIDLGTDIFTVSKLLGHHDVRTTQIYAKVLDRKKQEAVMKIPNLLINKDC